MAVLYALVEDAVRESLSGMPRTSGETVKYVYEVVGGDEKEYTGSKTVEAVGNTWVDIVVTTGCRELVEAVVESMADMDLEVVVDGRVLLHCSWDRLVDMSRYMATIDALREGDRRIIRLQSIRSCSSVVIRVRPYSDTMVESLYRYRGW